MILVDSSVWIAHLRGHRTPAVAKLEAAASREPLLIGDLILLEVLQGARDGPMLHAFNEDDATMPSCRFWIPISPLRAARNHRKLRDERAGHHDPQDSRHHHWHLLHRASPLVAAR